MNHPGQKLKGVDETIQVKIGNQLSDTWGSGGTGSLFAPQPIFSPPGENVNGDPGTGSTVHAPEKKLTLFALQLAVLEKMATGLGALGLVWATVVLLGGFVILLTRTDFWYITIILLVEGTRIFSRSNELEWQHHSTWSNAGAGIKSFNELKSSSRDFIVRAMKGNKGTIAVSQGRELEPKTDEVIPSNGPTRRWASSEVPLLPYVGWFFLSKNISRLLYWLQFISASTCITLSVVRFVKLRNSDAIPNTSDDYHNMRSALYIFYGLALAEALLSLLEKLYWEWMITYRRLLEEVNKDCELGSSGMISIKRFFYDAYSDCVNGSIFDGLKLDLVSFAIELLDSQSSDEQLIGARILLKFSTNPRFSNDTLRKIGTSISVIERLVEMLNWKNPQEAEIRRAAAEIVSLLAGEKQNSLRVAGIPGAMESISSLLSTPRSSDGASDEIGEKEIIVDPANYEFSVFNHLGLTILKELARDRGNCEKIGNTRGLLPKIIDFTHTGEMMLKDSHEEDSRLKAVKRSLQVVKLLARTAGPAGKHLRGQIVEIVFTVSNIREIRNCRIILCDACFGVRNIFSSLPLCILILSIIINIIFCRLSKKNIREILKYGEKYPMLQHIGIKILTYLSFEAEATERIGSTGGIIKQLFSIFFQDQIHDDQNQVRVAAGEAIAKLAQKSEKNCYRILNQNVLTKLVTALEDPVLHINSARILRDVCTYAGQDCFVQLKGVCAAAPTVLKVIMSAENENKQQEVMLGLAAQVFRFMNPEEARKTFNQTEVDEVKLATKILEILEFYQYPSPKVPRTRRFAIELAISMMENNKATVGTFRNLGMEEVLQTLAETTYEIESFDIFDGTVGLSRHTIEIHTIVENALELLKDY